MFETLKRLCKETLRSEKKETRCLCCGECCEFFGWHLQASRHDIERWQSEGREDLLSRVNRLGWIWVDPETKEPLNRCPYIGEKENNTSKCAIYATRPDICRAYPTVAHGRRCLHGVFLK
ncbi:MAG: YkgJ family cysteine cluster protein [Desulfobacteraceae bacterium]|nr:YkgJ family cysteine cluster protein [Desulfobacteraceae bacterium]